MKKEISIRKQNFYRHILAGILFIISGILSCIPIKPISVSGDILAIAACIITAIIICSNKEHEDEMTKLYLGKAYTLGFYLILLTTLLMEITNVLTDNFFEKTLIGFGPFGNIIMGVGFLSVGLIFAKYDGGIFDANTND